MPGLILNGKEVLVSGLEIVNYKDDPKLKLIPGEDMRARHTRWIRVLCWHNTKNIPTVLKPGRGPHTDLEHRITNWWAKDAKNAGAHECVDWDGSVGCLADLVQDAAYHASALNEVSIGAELYEDNKGTIYEAQVEAAVKLTIWHCQHFGIQMQMPAPSNNKVIDRIKVGGENCVGIFGHCHQYGGKPEDPGVHIFQELEKAGFKIFDFQANEDLRYWKDIQRRLGVPEDGVPGPKTRDALQARGFPYGLYDFRTAL